MTAARLAAACLLLAITGCSSSDTDTPDPEPTAAAETAAYLDDLGPVDGLNDRHLIAIGEELCASDYLADFNEGEFFDQAGVTEPDRDRITTAAHAHLC